MIDEPRAKEETDSRQQEQQQQQQPQQLQIRTELVAELQGHEGDVKDVSMSDDSQLVGPNSTLHFF